MMHIKNTLRLLLLFLFICSLLIAGSKLQFANVGDLPLLCGDTLRNCMVGYRTFGELNKDSSNVIIYPTWFSGTSEQIGGLLGPGKLVDTTDAFVIALDALGNGISSSPSNSTEQENNFPEITIKDMVRSQYVLVHDIVGIKKVHAAIGGSMGSMQVFEWITMYPDYIEKAVPYVCTPKSTSNDLLQWHIRLEIIDSYRSVSAEEKQIHKILSMMSSLLGRTPGYLAENIDENNFPEYLQKFDVPPNERFTIENYRRQLTAMINHNIFASHNNSMDETAHIIKSKVLMIVASTDHLLHPKTSLEFAEKINARVLVLDNNCGHLAVGCELKRCGEEINNFLRSE